MNLLKETIGALLPHTPRDVLWVGSSAFFFTWDEFAAVADVEYDEGFGAQEVASDLVIVVDGWWLERVEYDGSEGWEEKSLPAKPVSHRTPSALTVGQHAGSSCGWERLEQMNPASE